MKKQNYLNNKDLLKEIHKSKNKFSSYTESEFHQYDIILDDIEKINIRTIAEAKRNKAKRLQQQEFETRKLAGEKIKLAECEVDYKKIEKSQIIPKNRMF